MGMDVVLESGVGCEHRPERHGRLRSVQNNRSPPKFTFSYDRRRDAHELWISTKEVECSYNQDMLTWGYVDAVEVRIHGVSMRHLLDALIENEDIRRYLASGVDHFRDKEKEVA